MKRELTGIILLLSFIISGISINTIAYADEHNFCDEWGIVGLGSVYLTSSTLKITENEIKWPGCQSAPYKIISMENNTAKLRVPRLKCSGIRKDSGQGYIMLLTTQDENRLKIKVYDARGNGQKEQELAWGEFYRIPFDKERKYFGRICDYPISMQLFVSKKGNTEGSYSYDKYKKEIPLRGKISSRTIILNTYDDTGKVLEIFDGKDIDGEIKGIWKHKGKALEFHLIRDPWDDHSISCEEMQKYPKRVFSGSVDLGSGHGSPNDVDYQCKGGLATLKVMKKLYDLAEEIRSEGEYQICTGSIVYAHWRYYNFELLEAGLAPDIYALHNEEWEKNAAVYQKYSNALKYFKLWAHQSLYNYELYNTFWKEYYQVKPALIRHYQERFNLPAKKATYYSNNALSILVRRAAGSYPYDLQEGKPDITVTDKIVANPKISIKRMEAIIKRGIPQDELDQALKTALLYQRPQKILKLLLKNGAKINCGDESALFFALRNPEHVKLLLRQGADVNYENGFGKTTLFYAIGFNDLGLVRLLLDHKADVNHAYKSNEVIEALRWNQIAFYQSYCGFSHTKRTPIMHAAQHGNVAIIKLLLQHGAKLNSLDQQGFNAADYARMGNKLNNLEYLRSLGLKENMASKS